MRCTQGKTMWAAILPTTWGQRACEIAHGSLPKQPMFVICSDPTSAHGTTTNRATGRRGIRLYRFIWQNPVTRGDLRARSAFPLSALTGGITDGHTQNRHNYGVSFGLG